ncbi:MAG: hypothetical protein R3249_11945 [Nitriliruptorales bacterium]|nr:hypothetical protein [Nitriliruptorales bacterium]
MVNAPSRTRRVAVAGVLAAVVVLVPTLVGAPGTAQEADPSYLLFSGEGNRLNVYDVTDLSATEFPKQTLIKSGNEGEKDFNAQVCFDPVNPTHFVGGEDTDQPDPPAGWGYFELFGTAVGELSWEQQGRFTPTYQPTVVSGPENYGCFFRDDNTMFTTDIGDQFPGLAGTGQLILWFPPFEGAGVLGAGGPYGTEEIEYCKIVTDIPTPGGIWVDDEDRVYITSNRPGPGWPDPTTGLDEPFGAVYRFSGDWPTSGDAAGGCGRTDGTGAPLVDEGRLTRETFITPDQLLLAVDVESLPLVLQPLAATPSAIWPSGNDTFYVSSVFTGVIAEYDEDGQYLRTIMQPSAAEYLALPPYPSTGTPYGIVVDDRGTIFYADLGVVTGPPPGPGNNAGSVRFITFDENNEPSAPQIIEEGLPFPDGVGLIRFDAAPDPEPGGGEMPTTGGGLVALALGALAVVAGRRRSA